jgi:hypothetical protein
MIGSSTVLMPISLYIHVIKDPCTPSEIDLHVNALCKQLFFELSFLNLSSMSLQRLWPPARCALSQSRLINPSYPLASRGLEASSATRSPALTFLRYAHHKSEGRANGSKDGAGKRLGAKKTGGKPDFKLESSVYINPGLRH